MLYVKKTLRSKNVEDDGKEKIPDSAIVKLTKVQGQYEIMYLEKKNRTIKIKKLDKDRYMTPDGEIRYFNHTRSRNENLNHVSESLKKIRNLTNHNFSGGSNEKWIILTYAENMMDSVKLYNDCKNFRRVLKRDLGNFEYLAIPEPQGRGAWHMNLLLKFENDPGFLSNTYIAKLWSGKGFAYVKAIGSVKGIGNYLSVYLSDMEYTKKNLRITEKAGLIENDKMIVKREVKGKSKKFIKGARLYLYPTNFDMVRKSRGIVYPEEEEDGYKKLRDKYSLSDSKYRRKVELLEYPKNKENEMILIARNIYEQY